MAPSDDRTSDTETGTGTGTDAGDGSSGVAAGLTRAAGISYLHIPAVDVRRAAVFYEAVFGWPTEHPYQDFESPGLIGQWVPGRPSAPDAGPMIWIHVADLDQTLATVVQHGGEIIDPPTPDGPNRTLATIVDPEGNPIGLASHASANEAPATND